MAVMSGIVPIAFEAPVTATQRVRSSSNAVTAAVSSRPVAVSNSAIRTVAPVSAAISSHGDTFESWSSRVHTISSPGPSSRPIARVIENTLLVVDGPNTKPAGSAPSNSPIVAWVRSTSASHASAAANAPWLLALLPLRCQSAEASIAVSTTWVPAGPSNRAQPFANPGKRSRTSTANRTPDTAVTPDTVTSDMAPNLLPTG